MGMKKKFISIKLMNEEIIEKSLCFEDASAFIQMFKKRFVSSCKQFMLITNKLENVGEDCQ